MKIEKDPYLLDGCLRIYDLCGSRWQVASEMTKYPVKTTIFYGKNSRSFRRCNSGLFLS